ncbi:serine/threonine-protein kinase PknK [Lusitaniella coriacea LEGE 07157]|uniref:Serine/threonine-protein kinase PknK n=1 Tax=Lusitaniella coriacea LEGE 07157 TaxID=945747 RepID=A0A8J7E3G6_9CYAN|nr:serine/threonine-protein kinase PknK [Lusitaniella coriacea]MBE9119171.1 serine/threonine-protein kinase PknK [Lusitaniella coriacea LEGE 07157]
MVAIPGYRVIEQLYSGERTLVYRGVTESEGHPVILKILKAEYPTFGELLQFRNQYAIAKNLDLPGIVKPLALKPYGNGYMLVMPDELAVSLNRWTEIKTESGRGEFQLSESPQTGSKGAMLAPDNRISGQFSIAEFLNIGIQLAEILHGLYQNRVIHKDIKPANILINPKTKQVKLIDFSISSLLPKETQQIQNPRVLEGTLAYISPEQTGRMNRGIDYRTDFYSLGVTFYELLAGCLPFESSDPMELIHCHIAQTPLTLQTFLYDLENPYSEALSAIIFKLMAKNAEDRYQSALGLKYDLEICLKQWQETGKIEVFELAQQDICDRFFISDKLYGREAEVAQLLAAFERISQDSSELSEQPLTPSPSPPVSHSSPTSPRSELVLVAGYSGVGKTAVINEVHKPIIQQRGYFIKGKFDQFKRDIPFSAWVQAFQNLIQQLLSESTAEVERWRADILQALGDSSRVIIEVIPELELLIGEQPEVPELEGTAAQNRFNLLFGKFIRAIAQKEHPLVIFLDDLQWADLASLKLMQLLMSESDTNHLLFIGAYRDNEVYPAHPLILTLEEIAKNERTINTINLTPLSQPGLNHLISDTLSCSLERAIPLTELVYQKTQGNPFFVTQFLKSLHRDGLIVFEPPLSVKETGGWKCDIAQIRSLALTDDIVEFMALQLQKLPNSTQDILKFAACIGNTFDLETLAIVGGKSQPETATALWSALEGGLILPQSEVYKFYQNEDSAESSEPFLIEHSQLPTYKFLHDRVQQAAYFLIPDAEKKSTHLKIGRLLLNNTPEAEREEKIFDIVNQLNIGVESIESKAERSQLAVLNLRAGKKAKYSTAYSAAARYLSMAMRLLPKDCWTENYDLTIKIYLAVVEAEYLNANFARSRDLSKQALNQAKTLLEKANFYTLEIRSRIAQNQMNEAIKLGLRVLKMLEIDLEEQPPEGLNLDALLNLPAMTDPYKIASMHILSAIISPAAIAKPDMMLPIILTMLKLCNEHGNSDLAIFPYAIYGIILCGTMGEIDRGYQFGKLALKLLDKLNAKKVRGRVLHAVSCCILYWRKSIEDSLVRRFRLESIKNQGYFIFTRARIW